MLILTVLLLSWTACCWFSQPFETPFLGLFIFSVDAAAPFICSILALLGAFLLWILRNGKTALRSTAGWVTENRSTLLAFTAIVLFHILIQIPAIVMYQGANDADSAQYGLAGYRIAEGKMRPMYALGKIHIGSLIHHLCAGTNLLFGKNPIYLRIFDVLFYIGFIIVLFALARRLFDRRTALLSAAIAAVPPYVVYEHIRHTEFPEILFWGTLSLYLLYSLVQSDNPKFRQFFWYGVILGLALWAHPQTISFVITGAIVLFIRDKLFFARPRFIGLLIGLLIGGTVILIQSYYYESLYQGYLTALLSHANGYFPKLADGISHFFTYLTFYIAAEYRSYDITFFHYAIKFIVTVTSIVCLFIYIYISRKEIIDIARFKNLIPKAAVFLILPLVVFLVFVLTEPARLVSSLRYVFPLWTAIPVIIAASTSYFSRRTRPVQIALTSLFLGTFFFSSLQAIRVICMREDSHSRWVKFCSEQGINRFYGPWVRTYWTNYVTTEEIIGAAYPMTWEPLMAYQQTVEDSATPPAYMFGTGDINRMEELEGILKGLRIRYRTSYLRVGSVVYGLSERITPLQFASLRPIQYRASLLSAKIQKITGLSDESSLFLLGLTVRNDGEGEWSPHGSNGFIELVALSETGEELSRQPLPRELEPGNELSWRTLVSTAAITDQSPIIEIQANGILINSEKRAWKMGGEIVEIAEPIPASELDILVSHGERQRPDVQDYMLVSGWRKAFDGVLRSGDKSSTLAFILERRRPLELELSITPFRGTLLPQGPRQMVILLNGSQLDHPITLSEKELTTIQLPKELQRNGLNLLSFAYKEIEPEFKRFKGKIIYHIRPRAVTIELQKVRDEL